MKNRESWARSLDLHLVQIIFELSTWRLFREKHWDDDGIFRFENGRSPDFSEKLAMLRDSKEADSDGNCAVVSLVFIGCYY